MSRRHQIMSRTAMGLGVPLLLGLGMGGPALAAGGTTGPAAGSPPPVEAAPADGRTAGASGEKGATDLFTAGADEFMDPEQTTITPEHLAYKLDEFEGDRDDVLSPTCEDGLDMADPQDVATCTVTGENGEETTFYAYLSPAASAEDDYGIYFARDGKLSEDAAEALNDGTNGTGAYPVGSEEESPVEVMDPETAVDQANYVLDGIGREDITVTDIEGEVDMTSLEPVRGTAVEEGSGREMGVTVLPVPSEGDETGLLVSIDGP